jgi:hypothetical protein
MVSLPACLLACFYECAIAETRTWGQETFSMCIQAPYSLHVALVIVRMYIFMSFLTCLSLESDEKRMCIQPYMYQVPSSPVLSVCSENHKDLESSFIA